MRRYSPRGASHEHKNPEIFFINKPGPRMSIKKARGRIFIGGKGVTKRAK
jgi:hypothetical protein